MESAVDAWREGLCGERDAGLGSRRRSRGWLEGRETVQKPERLKPFLSWRARPADKADGCDCREYPSHFPEPASSSGLKESSERSLTAKTLPLAPVKKEVSSIFDA